MLSNPRVAGISSPFLSLQRPVRSNQVASQAAGVLISCGASKIRAALARDQAQICSDEPISQNRILEKLRVDCQAESRLQSSGLSLLHRARYDDRGWAQSHLTSLLSFRTWASELSRHQYRVSSRLVAGGPKTASQKPPRPQLPDAAEFGRLWGQLDTRELAVSRQDLLEGHSCYFCPTGLAAYEPATASIQKGVR